MDYTVEYYEKDDGTLPAEEFILCQDNKMQAKIFATLELLEVNYPPLGFQPEVGASAACAASVVAALTYILPLFLIGKVRSVTA